MKPSRESMDFGRKTIIEKIDVEQKFEPGALYEMTGRQLQEYLAFAFREGQAAAQWKHQEANRAK